jgi:hypothetical protein
MNHVDVSEARGVEYAGRLKCLEEITFEIRLADSHNPLEKLNVSDVRMFERGTGDANKSERPEFR